MRQKEEKRKSDTKKKKDEQKAAETLKREQQAEKEIQINADFPFDLLCSMPHTIGIVSLILILIH